MVKRTTKGDFNVKLKLSKNPDPDDNGLYESELRAIFTRKSGFQLQEKLGQGTFGAVFKTTSDDGQVSAIKIVRMDMPEATLQDVDINNLMLRAVGGTPYEQLFSLPRGMLKIKRSGRDDQLALVMDKME